MKNRILYGSIIFLFLVNGFQLFLKFSGSNPHPPRPREVIIEQLGFDEQQILVYDELIFEHQRLVRTIEGELLDLKRKLYQDAILENIPLSELDFTQLQQAYTKLEKIHITHFLEIRSICHDDQQQKFDRFAPDFAELFRPKPPGNKSK